MPFDDAKYEARATHGDVASVVIDTIVALRVIQTALKKLSRSANVDLGEELDDLDAQLGSLNKLFDGLTGWTPE